MGRRQKGNKKGGRDEGAAPPKPRGYSNWDDIDKSNAAFEEYYKAQGIVPEDEWEAFMTSLKADLPTTFRVTGSRAHAETINELIQGTYVPITTGVELDGVTYEPPSQIPWYPGELAWQFSAPKRVVRKSEEFKKFQRFLVGETEVGNLSRQEAVSMIPPLLMDVEPHHVCLDMCAAPGSKTAQIIEALNPHHTSSTGLLIANDSDYKRTHLLVHQTGRMPSKGLLVTNMDASFYPKISLPGGKTLSYDRILADVPCSGDGTLRKNLEIWSKWTASDGNSLHSLQLRILLRAMDFLKPGARMVYSTCSFNPAENESVIAAALITRPGLFSLVDVSDHLPKLKRRPGLSQWKVATQPDGKGADVVWHETHTDYIQSVKDGKEKDKDVKRALPPSLWPPSNAAELNLERCLRLLPHDQDTGGFFVCVLEKPASKKKERATEGTSTPADGTATPIELPPVPPIDVVVADESGASSLKRGASSPGKSAEVKRPRQQSPKPDANGQGKKAKRDLSFKEDPYSYVDSAHEEVKSLQDWYKLKDTFPTDCLMVRNDYGDPLRTLYLTNHLVRDILTSNDYSRLRVISAGVKAFMRQDSQNRDSYACKWRIPNEGLSALVPHLGDGVVKDFGIDELRVLVEEQYPTLDEFSPEAKARLEQESWGNLILRFTKYDGEKGHLPMDLMLPVWKAKSSLSLLIDKREKSMLSLRTFGADICKPPPNFKQKTEVAAVSGVEAEGSAPAEVSEPPIEHTTDE